MNTYEVSGFGIIHKSKESSAPEAALAGVVGGPILAGGYGALKAKKGKKAKTGGRVAGRSFAEGAAGAAPGLALVAAKKPVGVPLMYLGAATGQGHGAYRAQRNAERRGDS